MKLTRQFFTRSTLVVAPELLGCHLVRRVENHLLIGIITEVEAYLGADDPASHARAGRTRRTAVMWQAGGHAYMYQIYGRHYCLNIVTEAENVPGAVLIRAVKPLMDLATTDEIVGPGRVCRAFQLSLQDNGLDCVTSEELFLETADQPTRMYQELPRIGVTRAADKLWRFKLTES